MQKSIIKAEPDSAKDLDKIAQRLIRAAGVGDKLPTPQDDIIATANLIKGGVIDLDDYKDSFLRKAGKVLFSGLQKIKGALAVGDKTIYISAEVPETQKPFLNFHEVAHNVIPWQKDAFELFADNSLTLAPDIEEGFEQEANYLSAKLLFQGDRFITEARDFELSLKTGIKFKRDYQASFHSTFWYYVSTHSRSCVLLVMRECRYTVLYNGTMDRPHKLLYVVSSKPFFDEFGGMGLQKQELFYSDHEIFKNGANECIIDITEIVEGDIFLRNKDGEKVEAKFERCSNSYNTFVLISKKDRTFFRKKRVEFTDAPPF